jgi:hypothetical protein
LSDSEPAEWVVESGGGWAVAEDDVEAGRAFARREFSRAPGPLLSTAARGIGARAPFPGPRWIVASRHGALSPVGVRALVEARLEAWEAEAVADGPAQLPPRRRFGYWRRR